MPGSAATAETRVPFYDLTRIFCPFPWSLDPLPPTSVSHFSPLYMSLYLPPSFFLSLSISPCISLPLCPHLPLSGPLYFFP